MSFIIKVCYIQSLSQCDTFPTVTSHSRMPMKKYTPLPLSQIAILLLLRFCEAASTFVIFPFLNEVISYFKRLQVNLTCVAPYFCDRRCKESRILRWLDGPSLESRKAILTFIILIPGCHSSTGSPCDCHVLESLVGPHWKEADTVTRNVGSCHLQSISWPFTDLLGIDRQVVSES